MRFGEIDFPEELIAAQQEGKLVVFAGAGVSIPPPSNYPSFKALTLELAKGTGLVFNRRDTFDTFLGRLDDKIKNVHERAHKLFSNPSSTPNTLHKSLLSLFNSPDAVRIVTTNYDSHFSTTATAEFKAQSVKNHFQPGLPIGDDFDGIVYLHGSVSQAAKFLVITDRDLGKAYLTEGWATKFLQKLFATYTVLFVGYSHDDTIVSYLARGLPERSGGRRFALTDSPEGAWETLGISPIPYKLQRGKNKHIAVEIGIQEWACHSRMGFLDYEKRLTRILEEPRSLLTPQSEDFLNYVYTRHIMRHLFFRHAKSLDWLKWVDEQGYLKPLFGLETADGKHISQLVYWLTHKYLEQYESDAFEIVLRHLGQNGRLHATLWRGIAMEFAYRREPIEPVMFARWVDMLVSDRSEWRDINLLEQLLDKCSKPGTEYIALSILNYLTRPSLKWEPSLALYMAKTPEERSSVARFSPKIEIQANDYGLRETWKTIFHERLDKFAERLLPLIFRQIETSYQMLIAAHGTDDIFDSLSYARPAIERHEQNHGYGELDPLIDFARDSLEWLFEHKPMIAEAYQQLILESPFVLLQRMGIYALSQNHKTRPDQAVRLVLQKKWLHSWEHHHEVYQLLKRFYPDSSEQIKIRLVKAVKVGPKFPVEDEETPRLRASSIYGHAQWLKDVAPEFHHFDALLADIQAKCPLFQPTEKPDLTHWTGSVRYGYESRKNLKELMELTVTEAAEYIHNYKGEVRGSFNELQEGLYRVIQAAVSQNPEWGIELLEAMKAYEDWERPYWGHLIYGFRAGLLDPSQWNLLLRTLNECPSTIYTSAESAIAEILSGGMKKQEGRIPDESLDLAEQIGFKLLDYLEKEESDIASVENAWFDWLNTAINRPTGKLIEFWIDRFDRSLEQAEGKQQPIEDIYRQLFERILKSSIGVATLGIPILFQRLPWFHWHDKEWTYRNLLPLLDWDNDDFRTEPAWD